MKKQETYVAKESATGKAIAYSLNQEKYLRVFLSDGRIPLDNNPAEQKISNFTIGRKNWVVVDYCPGHLNCQTTYIRNNPVTFIFNHRIFYVYRYLLCIAYLKY